MTAAGARGRADVSQQGGPVAPGRRLGVLLGFVLALVVVVDLPVVHAHEAPGLYDEVCSLERLAAAAAAPAVPLPAATDLPHPTPVLDPPPTGPVTAAARVPFGSFESRAPPVLGSR
jgi:hypothetical protein